MDISVRTISFNELPYLYFIYCIEVRMIKSHEAVVPFCEETREFGAGSQTITCKQCWSNEAFTWNNNSIDERSIWLFPPNSSRHVPRCPCSDTWYLPRAVTSGHVVTSCKSCKCHFTSIFRAKNKNINQQRAHCYQESNVLQHWALIKYKKENILGGDKACREDKWYR